MKPSPYILQLPCLADLVKAGDLAVANDVPKEIKLVVEYFGLLVVDLVEECLPWVLDLFC